jgi:hypothetical protein
MPPTTRFGTPPAPKPAAAAPPAPPAKPAAATAPQTTPTKPAPAAAAAPPATKPAAAAASPAPSPAAAQAAVAAAANPSAIRYKGRAGKFGEVKYYERTGNAAPVEISKKEHDERNATDLRTRASQSGKAPMNKIDGGLISASPFDSLKNNYAYTKDRTRAQVNEEAGIADAKFRDANAASESAAAAAAAGASAKAATTAAPAPAAAATKPPAKKVLTAREHAAAWERRSPDEKRLAAENAYKAQVEKNDAEERAKKDRENALAAAKTPAEKSAAAAAIAANRSAADKLRLANAKRRGAAWVDEQIVKRAAERAASLKRK